MNLLFDFSLGIIHISVFPEWVKNVAGHATWNIYVEATTTLVSIVSRRLR